jgi:hypothetical protein
VVRGGSPSGPHEVSVEKHAKIVSDTERMENTCIHVCDKTSVVRWPSTESRRISSFHNFLSFNHYFRKYFKLVYIKSVVMVILTARIMFLLFTCIHFWVWEILRKMGGPRVPRPPMKWSENAESLSNTAHRGVGLSVGYGLCRAVRTLHEKSLTTRKKCFPSKTIWSQRNDLE